MATDGAGLGGIQAQRDPEDSWGMLVKDVMQCFPNEHGELLHVVEFIVYNTPGPHGYTPRDIDRRWSIGYATGKRAAALCCKPV